MILGGGEDRLADGGIEPRIADTVKVLKSRRAAALDLEAHQLVLRAGLGDRLKRVLADEAARQMQTIRRRRAQYDQVHASVPVAGRTVIVVDDGLAKLDARPAAAL